MSHIIPSGTIARTLLLAGILLAVTVLASQSFFPAFAQEGPDEILYDENRTDEVAEFTATDPEMEDVTWTLTDGDAVFNINETTGVLTFESTPDYEAPASPTGTGLEAQNTYTVTVQATETGDAPNNTDTITVMVKVVDVDEDGVMEGTPLQPKVGTNISVVATLTDDDGQRGDRTNKDISATGYAASVEWTWFRSMEADGPWEEIVATTTTNTNVKTNTRTPEADDVNRYLRVVAEYFDGNSPTDAEEFDKEAEFITVNSVIAADYVPAAPMFLDEDGNEISSTTRQVLESKGPGDTIDSPVVATDIGADGLQEILIYSINDSETGTYGPQVVVDSVTFVIDDRSGQLSLGDPAVLNYDGGSAVRAYTVWVRATDPTNRMEEIDVTVEVLDVNEPPDFTTTATTTEHAEFDSSGTATYDSAVQTFEATDPEGETNLVWSVRGRDGSRFNITTAGALTFKTPPDYENPPRSGANNNVYRITVDASDRGDGGSGRNVKTASHDFEVEVTPVQEGQTLTVSHVGTVINRQVTATVRDPDGRDGNVLWTWTLGDTSTSSEDFTATFTPRAEGTLTVEPRYTDGHDTQITGLSQTVEVVASVSNNSAPAFAANSVDRSVPENSNPVTELVGGAVTATDADSTHNRILTYSLAGGDTSFFTINMTDGVISTSRTLNREVKSSYRLTVRATDPQGSSDTITVNIEVTDVAEAPEITSGDNAVRHAEKDTGVIETYAATDPEDSSSALNWSVVTDGGNSDSTDFEINDSGQLKFAAEPNFEPAGDDDQDQTYDVRVQVEDSGGLTAFIDVDVVLTNVQEAGTVTITPDQQPKVGETPSPTAALTDPDVVVTNTIAWQWGRSRNSTGPFTPIEGATSTTYAPVAADVGHYLQVEATYDDGETPEDNPDTANVDESMTKASAVTRFVVAPEDYDNTAPVFQDAEGMATTTAVRMVDENSPVGTNVGLPFAATDLDVDGNQENLSYAFVAGRDEGFFTIVEGTGQIHVGAGPATTGVDVPFNYEDIDNSDHQFTVVVRATDPSGLDTGPNQDITVTIMVVDLEEDPEIVEETETENLSEVDYDEEQATTTYPVSLYDANDEEDDSDIDPRDPVALTWSLSGRDMDDFIIATSTADSTKQALSFKGMPNYERPADSDQDNVYNVTVVATDSDGGTDMRDVTVRVQNIDEPGTVTLSNLQPEAGIPITATLEDPDDGVNSVEWQWYTAIAEDSEGTAIPGTEATERTYTPDAIHATGNGGSGYWLRAVATYKDNASVDDPDTPNVDESIHMARTTSANPVQPKDDMNETPQFTDQDPNTGGKQTTRQIPERELVSGEVVQPSLVGAPVTATDEPTANGGAGEILTYSLSGPHAGLFTIDRGTDSGATPPMEAGQIRVAEGTKLDYEDRKTYTVVVTATDPSSVTDQITVTIEVTDFDEDPVVTRVEHLRVSGDASPTFDENQTGNVATYRATVPDGSTPTWSKSGPDSNVFSLTGGVLSVDSALDYETPSDANGDNVYEVTVTATGGGMSRDLDVDVTLVNVDEEGTVTLSSDTPQVGVELTASLDDLDGNVSSESWQWQASSSGTGDWTDASGAGATSNAYTPVEADVGNFLRATVEYTDGHDSGKSAESDATGNAVRATVPGTDGTLALSLSQPIIGESIAATLTDADNPDSTTYSWLWERSTNNSSWSTVSGASSANYTVGTADAGNYLRATVTYTDDSGPGQTATAATTRRVPIDAVYDADYDGTINSTEVLTAVADYFRGDIGATRVLQVVALYFAGLN